MKFEVRRYNTNGFGTQMRYNEEGSMPVRELSDEEVKTWMGLLEFRGATRFENENKIWYDVIFDRYHSEQHIFWK